MKKDAESKTGKNLKFQILGFVVLSLTAFLLIRPLSFVLPRSLLVNKTGFSQAIYDRQGTLLRFSLSSDEKFRIWTPLHEIPESVQQATLAQEDAWFYFHLGVNPFSLVKALFSTMSSGKKIGGSTITMQLARLRFGIRTRSILGKIKQIIAAIGLELTFSKNEIMEAYLNLAPYGGNIEGVGAASQIYFGKIPSRLTNAESYTLSVVPQHPNQRAPNKKAGLIEIAAARERLLKRADENSPTAEESERVISNTTKKDLPFFAPHFTQRLLKSFPLESRIKSSLDLGIQRRIERITWQFIEKNKKIGIQNASVMILEYTSMKVRGYVGSAEFFNDQILGQVDGVSARRSPGSALKPFVYGLALDQGLIHPGSMLKDTSFSKAAYNPENFDREFMGPLSATEALIRSRNLPAVFLLNQLSTETFYNFLQRTGVGQLKEPKFYGLSLVLGGVEVRMDELSKMYAMLANGGVLRPLHFLESENDISQKGSQLLSPEAAFLTLKMLEENPRPSDMVDSTSTKRNFSVPWKTGTSFGFRDAWAVGIVGEYIVAVWIGNFDGKSNPAFIGREAAGPLFFNIADSLDANTRLFDSWSRPGLNIRKVNVCSVSGELPGPFCKTLKASWFIPGKSPIHTCEIHREITVDQKTGLRLCLHSHEEGIKEIFEFWPSDLLKLFRDAGIARRVPPAFSSECRADRGVGMNPLISSPDAHLEYVVSDQRTTVPLSAITDAESKKVYWFVDDSLVGVAAPGETFLWAAPSGTFLVRAVDEQGRANAVTVTVKKL